MLEWVRRQTPHRGVSTVTVGGVRIRGRLFGSDGYGRMVVPVSPEGRPDRVVWGRCSVRVRRRSPLIHQIAAARCGGPRNDGGDLR